MRELSYILSSLIKWAIFFGILYLIFTNFGTFLIIIFVLIAVAYYAIYQFKKKLKDAAGQNGFKFTFNGQDFSNMGGMGGNTHGNFDFRDFEEQFRRGNFQHGAANFGEVSKAKEFFGFTSDPSKDEIKKKYKELARKYHPDINEDGDELMKQLNHYKDVLLQAFPE